MAQESDRYNRVAKVGIQVVQNLVAATVADRANSDFLREADALEEFSLFLQRQGASQELQAECLRKLSSRSFAFLPRATDELTTGAVERMDLGEVQQREEEEEEREREATTKAESRRKQQAWNVDKTSKLGSNPRDARSAFLSFSSFGLGSSSYGHCWRAQTQPQ